VFLGSKNRSLSRPLTKKKPISSNDDRIRACLAGCILERDLSCFPRPSKRNACKSVQPSRPADTFALPRQTRARAPGLSRTFSGCLLKLPLTLGPVLTCPLPPRLRCCGVFFFLPAPGDCFSRGSGEPNAEAYFHQPAGAPRLGGRHAASVHDGRLV